MSHTDEWLCGHGVGHPFPDRPHHGRGIHGCDGCCSAPKPVKVAYVAGPYSARTPWQTQNNIRAAMEVALKYWRLGYATISPHGNSALMDGEVDYEAFMQGDLEFVRRSDVIVMMPLWKQSAGAVREHALAEELGKEIIYEQ